MIFIIGMPAVGKSYLAKQLGKNFGFRCIDLDEYIETKTGNKIDEIFMKYGEGYFREVETTCLSAIVKDNMGSDIIVACGGGTPVYGTNMQLMKEHGCVVYIEAELAVLAERINNDDIIRPMFLNAGDVMARLHQLYLERKPYYELADQKIGMNDISINKLEKIITICTGKQY
ncbi:MAG: shikimate kinase [Chitinophagales bacterium]|nr:shikimate kinase [Chitinophagales bacterium]